MGGGSGVRLSLYRGGAAAGVGLLLLVYLGRIERVGEMCIRDSFWVHG